MLKSYSHHINKGDDILLVHTPVWHIVAPNVGLSYVAQYLRDRNIRTSYFDMNNMLQQKLPDTLSAKHWNPARTESWANDKRFESETYPDFKNAIEETADYIVSLDIPIIGFSLNRTNRLFTLKLVQALRARNPELTLICGGFLCGIREVAETLLAHFDACVVGEGELAALKIVDAIKNGKNLDDIPGVLTATNTRDFKPAELPPLEQIHYPEYDFVDLENYKLPGTDMISLHINASRGCHWGRCTFCQSAKIMQGYRARNSEEVLDELRFLKSKGASHFYFSDLAFGKDVEKSRTFLDNLAEEVPGIILGAQMRISRHYDRDFFDRMKKAGFTSLSFGLESGSQKIINRIRKGFKIDTASKCLHDCHEAGIRTTVFIIVGHPEETEKDFYDTYQYIIDHKSDIDQIEQICLFEFQYGTPAYDSLNAYKEQLGLRHPERAGENGNVFLWEIPGVNDIDIRTKRQQILYMLAAQIGMGKGHYTKQEDVRARIKLEDAA